MKRTPALFALSALLGVSELVAQTSGAGSAQTVAQAVAAAAAVSAATGSSSRTTVVAPASPVVVPPTPVQPALVVGLPSEGRLSNLSTRARVAPGSPLITGFAIKGATPLPVLVRAAGPGLSAFGVSGVIAAPRLEVRDANGTVVAANAGWSGTDALADAFARTGAFPFAPGSADSAAVATLAPGTYTVQISDATGGPGGATLAEIYEIPGTPGDSRLANVSTRTMVAPAGGELISGFVVSGTAPRRFLVRGIGPTLAKFGVSGALADPMVTLFDASNRQIASNNNWSQSPATAGAVGSATQAGAVAGASSLISAETVAALTTAYNQTGAFALESGSVDAATVVTLAPGAYTVQVSGIVMMQASASGGASGSGSTVVVTAVPASYGGSGVALLEIYELP